MVQPGDLILVRTPGWVFRVGRRLCGNTYDHIAVVVQNGQTVNIDKPMSRTLPMEKLLRPHLSPLVLRPAWAHTGEQENFVDWISQAVDSTYDTRRTLSLVWRVLVNRWLGVKIALSPMGAERERWICTDAVLIGLSAHASRFEDLPQMELDWRWLGSGTTNDFLEISRLRPEHLVVVFGRD